MENNYLNPDLKIIIEEIDSFDYNLFQDRCDNILNLLEAESPMFEALIPEEEREVAVLTIEDREVLEKKMHLEIGKYVVSDMGGFNELGDEEISKIFQLEVEILLSLDRIMMEGHQDLFLIEDLIFLARMLRYSVLEDENQKTRSIIEFVEFFKEEWIDDLDFRELQERGENYVSLMREDRRSLVKLEFEARFKYNLEVMEAGYALEEEGNEEDLKEAVAGLERVYKELENIYINALGYNKVYSIPVRVLKNLMLTISSNFYSSSTSAIIFSNEYVALYTKE